MKDLPNQSSMGYAAPLTLSSSEDFLWHGGEMAARMLAMDWRGSGLGAPATWPPLLKMALRIVLSSRQPMFVWWGDELLNLYNDAYISVIGARHPTSLGQPAARVWSEIWETLLPRITSAMQSKEGTYDEALLLIMERNGYAEETYYTFSYTPLLDDHNVVRGIICANSEDTQRIIGARQLLSLRELAAHTADAKTLSEACHLSVDVLQSNARDVPFALIYWAHKTERYVELVALAGIERAHPLVRDHVSWDDMSGWPFTEAVQMQQALYVVDMPASLTATLPCGAWDIPPRQCAVLTIGRRGQSEKNAILIIALNPFRILDDNYRGFLELAATQISAAIGNAQAYAEERQRAEALSALDRAKTAFFSNVSHEFRTPLALILGPLDSLLEHMPAAEREQLAMVRRNAQRLLKLVNTLLDFSRLEAGRLQAFYEPLDLAVYTEELSSVFRAAVEAAGMRLIVDCPPLAQAVFIDRELWEKIVFNLLSNAFKYTHEGVIKVSLRAEAEAVVLCVEDTGIGIPASDLPKIFTRFHRVENAQGRTMEGSGIGLALVQELTKLHGGSVRVDSEYGVGSSFYVVIPLGSTHLPSDRVGHFKRRATRSLDRDLNLFVEEALHWLPERRLGAVAPPRDELEAGAAIDSLLTSALPDELALRSTLEQARAAKPPTAASAAPIDVPATILLADDNADMRGYVRRLLTPRYTVIAVGDGLEAFDVALAQAPALILTDVMMPRLDGFGLLQKLRADPRTATVPVIMLSARAGQEARIEGLQAGADDYLMKPFSARELLARVESALAIAGLRDEAAQRERGLRTEISAILESMDTTFFAIDGDFIVTYANAAAEKSSGSARADLLGKTLWQLFPDALDTLFEQHCRRAVAQRSAVYFEYFYALWGRWYEINVALMPNNKFGIYLHDITAQKSSEAALQEMNSQLETLAYERWDLLEQLRENDRRKDEFLATLAHELRNPLAPLRNGLQILRLSPESNVNALAAQQMMERQLQQMVRLVDELLDLSRINMGKVELHKERVELLTVLHNAFEVSRPLIDEAQQQLMVSIADEPIFVDADTTRLSQVFTNLLNNASKYTEDGGCIDVVVRCGDGEVSIAVKDNGVGIASAELPHVFEMFAQVQHHMEKSRGGLGIGLSIVKRLVDMHGGSVEVHSAGIGLGSEFIVRLPTLIPLADAPPPAIAIEPVATAALRRKILVADDNVDAATSMAMLLTMMGNDVQVAHDGQQACEMAEQFRPRVIILDIGMPKLNGYAACRLIREQAWSAGTTIIALTGWGQEEDKRRSEVAGFDHHLVKPVEPEVLEKLLIELGAGG